MREDDVVKVVPYYLRTYRSIGERDGVPIWVQTEHTCHESYRSFDAPPECDYGEWLLSLRDEYGHASYDDLPDGIAFVDDHVFEMLEKTTWPPCDDSTDYVVYDFKVSFCVANAVKVVKFK